MVKKMKVLTECRRLLKLMNLCVKSEMRLFGSNIPHFVVFIALSIPLCYSVVMHIWKAFEIGTNSNTSGIDMKKLANILLMIVSTTQMQLIYFALQFKNHNIIQTVDRIQEVVDRSKFYCDFYFI